VVLTGKSANVLDGRLETHRCYQKMMGRDVERWEDATGGVTKKLGGPCGSFFLVIQKCARRESTFQARLSPSKLSVISSDMLRLLFC